MNITMATASIPVMRHYLGVLSDLLSQAEAHAEAHKIKPEALIGARLFPDMYPLSGQVQFACDFAKGAAARLSGSANPGFADDETSFAELQARIDKTLAYIDTIDPRTIANSELTAVTVRFGKLELAANGHDYLLGFALPSMIFHISIAYALLRHSEPTEKHQRERRTP